MRPLPTPPLFPYTTLFRSRDHIVLGEKSSRLRSVGQAGFGNEIRVVLPDGTDAPVGGIGEIIVRRDRKSTRLNSSHRCISYAVFCLKKKNTDVRDSARKQH